MYGDEHDTDLIDEMASNLMDLAADEGHEITQAAAYRQAATHTF